jgi:ABC-type dipeptide/oligopeptide/nickel transport systems, permease components
MAATDLDTPIIEASLVATGTGKRAETGRRRREVRQILFRSPTFLVGAFILAFWIFDALFWRLIAPQDPQALTPDALKVPSAAHLLGTDNLGPTCCPGCWPALRRC